MIGLAQSDRWTCPRCLVTEVPSVGKAELHAAIVRAQQLHARQHAAERHLPAAGAR